MSTTTLLPCPNNGLCGNASHEPNSQQMNECRAAAQGRTGSTSKRSASIAPPPMQAPAVDLSDLDPSDIDGQVAPLYYARASANHDMRRDLKALDRYEADVAEGGWNAHGAADRIRLANDRIAKASEEIARLDAEIAPLEEEFQARGGWTRAFLVNNSNGHVHRDRACSTCNARTDFSWMTDYSGMDESDIVEAAGYRACTVCYTSAPTGATETSHPSKMFTPDEVEAAARKNEKKIKDAEKAAKKAEKAITMPDGSPLTKKGWRNHVDVFENERGAQIEAVDFLYSAKMYGVSDYVARNEDAREFFNKFITALAYKRGKPEDEILAEIYDKANKKLKAEGGVRDENGVLQQFGPDERIN